MKAIKALNDKLNQTRASFAPRSKFSFKSSRQSSATSAVSHHKNPSAISLEDAAELASQQRLKLPGARHTKATGSGDTSTAESSAFASPAGTGTPANEREDNHNLSRQNGAGLDAAGAAQDGFVNKNLSGEQQAGSPVRKPSFSGTSSVTIAGHSGLHIILPPTASHATSSGTIANLRRCIVDMSQPTAQANGGAPFAGLAVKNVRDSLLVCGRVAGAIHITSVEGSVLVVNARQFRMHECKNVDVYLQSASRPIIEDCEGIRFAPLPDTYVSIISLPWMKGEELLTFVRRRFSKMVQGRLIYGIKSTTSSGSRPSTAPIGASWLLKTAPLNMSGKTLCLVVRGWDWKKY